MKARDIKTIDVQAKEWFDKVNGNSYFSMDITVNCGRENEQSIYVPMQYGYGEHYKYVAFDVMRKQLKLFRAVDGNTSPFRVYEKYNIKANHSKQENCKKREL